MNENCGEKIEQNPIVVVPLMNHPTRLFLLFPFLQERKLFSRSKSSIG